MKIWAIAGSDSSGAAGVQMDVRVGQAFGVHVATVVTATTAQSIGGFRAAHPVSVAAVRDQLAALREDGEPLAVKVGMLASGEIADAVAEVLESMDAFVVVDPVLSSTSGGALADERAVERLLRRADLVTPNGPELERLGGAAMLLERGAQAVYFKGGHVGGEHATDQFLDRKGQQFTLSAPRSTGAARGTGCAFSTAVAANVSAGEGIADALVAAKAFVTRGIRLAREGLFDARSVAVEPVDFPWMNERRAAAFLPVGPRPLGFYPIVDRADWLPRLAGATTAQLRVKKLEGDALRHELKTAIAYAHAHDIRLFINDHWELAIALGAYGVHLGQEDLDTADLGRIAAAGLRLGVSTHSYAEAARANAVRPSYVALGPIFETTCKSMRFGPQGLERIADWRGRFDVPIVAIGGLKVEHARQAMALGADGVAVISDVLAAPDPEGRARQWLGELHDASVHR